jgi:DNA repair protein SbcC/Rad50
MIKKLDIQNFQSHKDSTLEFHSGVNVIIGNSDSGKTAVIRAIKLLATNRPSGDAFRSHWGGDMNILLETDTDTVLRSKGKENLYQLNETRFNAFGTDVPEEIRKALNLNEINLQQQLDQPFLLTSSPGEVAQHFNKVAHLDQIDDSLRKVQSWLREIEGNLKFQRAQKEQAEGDLKRYDHLEKLEAEVEVLEDMESDLIQKVQGQHRLESIISSLEDVTQELAEKSEILKIEKPVEDILLLYKVKQDKHDSQRLFQELIEEYKKLQFQIEEQESMLETEPFIKAILVNYDLKRNKGDLRQAIQELITTITLAENSVKTKENNLKSLEKQFTDNFPDSCPLCDTLKSITLNFTGSFMSHSN